jgi:hypothetical protein
LFFINAFYNILYLNSKQARIRATGKTGPTTYGIKYFDNTFDVCKFAEGAKNMVLNTLLPGFRESSGMKIKQCPFSGLFQIKDFLLDTRKIPLIRSGKQKFEMNFMYGQYRPIMSFSLFAEVAPLFRNKTGVAG